MFAVCCQTSPADGEARGKGDRPSTGRRLLLKEDTLDACEIIDSRNVLPGFHNPLVFSPRSQPSASANRVGFSPRVNELPAASPGGAVPASPMGDDKSWQSSNEVISGALSSRAQTYERASQYDGRQVGGVYLPVPSTGVGVGSNTHNGPTGEYETVFTPLYLHKLALTPRDVPLSSQYLRSPAGSMTARPARTADAEALRAGLKQFEDLRRAEQFKAEELRRGRLRAQHQIRDRALQARENRLRQLAEYDARRRALREEAERRQQEKLQRLRRAREEAAKAQAEKSKLLLAPPLPPAPPVKSPAAENAGVPAGLTAAPSMLKKEEDPLTSPRAAKPLLDNARQSAVLLPSSLKHQGSSNLSFNGVVEPTTAIVVRNEVDSVARQESAHLQPTAEVDTQALLPPSGDAHVGGDEGPASDIASPRASSNARPSGFRRSRDRQAAGVELNKALQKQEFKRMETRRASATSSAKLNVDDENETAILDEEAPWWLSSPARAWLTARKMPPAPTADQQKSIDDFAVSKVDVIMLNPDGTRSECELSMHSEALNLAPQGGKEVTVGWKYVRLVSMWDAASKTTKLLTYLRSKTFTSLREMERPFFLLVEYVDEKQFMKRMPLIFRSRALCYAANLALAAVRDFHSQSRN